MSQFTSRLLKRWKLILNIVTLIALILTIYLVRHDILTTYKDIFHIHAWYLILIIPIELIDYHAQTKLYQHLFRIVGNKLSYKYLFFASLELNFVNHVFPSGGAAGISYFGLKIKNKEISGSKATLIQIMKLVLTFFSFEILLIISMFLLALGNKVNSFTILISGALTTILIVGSALFVYIIGDKRRINGFLGYITNRLNQFVSLIFSTKREVINIEKAKLAFNDFHQTFLKLRKNKQDIRAPLVYALLANSAEIIVIYIVFLAFGYTPNLGAVILAYGVANFAGLVSVLPGGVGIYEALMTGVFLATGISAAISLPVIIMYRILNTLLQIPPGYYLYQRNLSHRERLKG